MLVTFVIYVGFYGAYFCYILATYHISMVSNEIDFSC